MGCSAQSKEPAADGLLLKPAADVIPSSCAALNSTAKVNGTSDSTIITPSVSASKSSSDTGEKEKKTVNATSESTGTTASLRTSKSSGSSGGKDAKTIKRSTEQSSLQGLQRQVSSQRGSITSHNEGTFLKGGFIMDNEGFNIHDYYKLEKQTIGEGAYGSVCKGKNKATEAVRAVKTIVKSKMKNMEKFKNEIKIMKMMDHPNIIKLFENFEDHRNVYLVLELCTGGELFDRIIEMGHFTETQAATVMQDIVRAIFHMHKMRVCHRDLKPENFLFTTKDRIGKGCTVKIIDFGLSKVFTDGQVLSTKAGTPYYVAPQVLAGEYDHTSDLWSCGVIAYVLLCGYPPFYGEDDSDVLKKVKLGLFDFNPADWKNISKDAKDLIRHLLKMDPVKRYTAEQALNHVWIQKKAPQSKDLALQTNFVEKLRGFRSQNKLKKAALHVIAGQMDESSIASLRNTFINLDGNGDGLLTIDEMKEGLSKSGLEEMPTDLLQILQEVDSDNSGVIDYTEFLAATLDKRAYIQEDVVWSAFRVFDRNGDGVITQDELRQVVAGGELEEMWTVEAIEEMMKEVDSNGDGQIDFQEFLSMMRSSNAALLKEANRRSSAIHKARVNDSIVDIDNLPSEWLNCGYR